MPPNQKPNNNTSNNNNNNKNINNNNNDKSSSFKESKRKGNREKDSAPAPKSPVSNPPESSPSNSPPLPKPLPPPPQSSSPPPPKSSPPPPSSPPPYSPPPPSPSPSPPPPPPQQPPPSPQLSPPQALHNVTSSSSSPHKQSPPPPQFQSPPPPERSSSSSSPSPPPDHKAGHSGRGGGGGAQAKPKGSSSRDLPPSDIIGYTLGGIFIFTLVAVAVILMFRRRKTRGDVYAAPYVPPRVNSFRIASGADGYYYVQQQSFGKTHGNGNIGGSSVKQLGAGPLDSAQPKSAQVAFTYDMVMDITNAFSSQNVIGEGGFGCVYKGCLPDGKAVAVKQLKAGSGQGEREFRAEVEIISRVHHRHLVSLVGYCISEQQRVLIYEYVPNGNLHHHLHGSGMPVLDWDKRLKIAIGAAKGLAYLHEDCSQKIIHRDIKSPNILLDDAFEAQVADFGLAKLADAANTHVSTRVMGTFGYMAPEYATSGKLTDRSDVFSFGVVLLELVTGRKPVDETQPLGDESLVEWARPLLIRAFETRQFGELVDPRLQNHFVEDEMFRMVEAAAACIRHSAPNRPRMSQVVRALDSGDDVSDLSNGMKYGQSTVYDSGQYDKDIMLFRRMGNGSFDFDAYSREYNLSREASKTQHNLVHSSSSGESESRAFNKNRTRSTQS